jgi:hypothetical protein
MRDVRNRTDDLMHTKLMVIPLCYRRKVLGDIDSSY